MTRTDADVVAFALDASGSVVIPVRVDGQGPFRFLLDTGSSHSAISAALAQRLGLAPVAKAEIMSASGQSLRPVVKLGRLLVGGCAREAILASVLQTEDLQPLGVAVDGVLGQDFLSAFDYTLDYQRGRLTWTAGSLLEMPAARLSLAADGGRFVATLPQGAGRGDIRLVPDSGSAALVIFGGASLAGREVLAVRMPGGAARMQGVAGARAVDRAIVPVLRVGDLVLRNEPALLVRGPAPAGEDSDGLLPLHRFARVSFNARERCLLVWAR